MVERYNSKRNPEHHHHHGRQNENTSDNKMEMDTTSTKDDITTLSKQVENQQLSISREEQPRKHKGILPKLRQKWKEFECRLTKFELQEDLAKKSVAFSFVEG